MFSEHEPQADCGDPDDADYMAEPVAAAIAAVGSESVLVKDHQAYFVKSAEKVNSTLHAAICKFCHAQDVEMKDSRTCLWQARDCIRHLARCPNVTESVRNHFKEEARLLNARLNSKKRTFQDMNSKPDDNLESQYPLPSSDAQPAGPAQLLDNSAAATGKKVSQAIDIPPIACLLSVGQQQDVKSVGAYSIVYMHRYISPAL